MKLRIKIICGYAVISIIGGVTTTAGFLIGNYYQKQALHQREIASKDRKLISQLQVDILYNRPAKQLSPYLDQPEEFRLASSAFQERLLRIIDLLAAHNSSPQSTTIPGLQTLLKDYQITVEKFNSKLTQTIKEIEPLTLSPSPQETIQAKELIIVLAKGQEFAEFIEFPDQLAEFAQMAHHREQQADVDLATADKIRTQIAFASLFFSLSLATTLGLYVTKAITKPLSNLTQVAQRITTESDFKLQVPVTTKDEVGVLATAFNEMVTRIKNYTEQLQQANQTLEQKVLERTQELNQTLNQLQHTQAKIIQAEKMSALSQMVAGIAHEINNPVSFVYTNLTHLEQYSQDLLKLIQLYEQEYPHPNDRIKAEITAIDLDYLIVDLPKIVNSMKVGSQRIYQMVESLRNFARLDEVGLKSVDIHEGIESTLMLLGKRLQDQPNHQKISIVKNYSQLPPIDCYPSQLNQVFFYLLSNAIDSLDEYNHNRTLKEIVQKPSKIIIHTQQLDSDWVSIKIIDNGLGINSEVQKRIFDPFFTTKPVGKGTGLGLSISYQIIVDKHGGVIWCHSVFGERTEFVIKLPIHSETYLKTD